MIIRPSTLNQFLRCRRQWYRTHVLGEQPIPSARAAVGTAIHKAAEIGYAEKIISHKLPPLSTLLDAAVETYHEQHKQGLLYDEGENEESAEKKTIEGTKAYWPIMQKIVPIASEKQYSIDLGKHKISGTVDLIHNAGVFGGEALVLADIKTMSKKRATSDYLLQQSLYFEMLRRNDINVQAAQIHGIIHGKGSVILDLALNVTAAKRVVNTILDTLDALEAGGDPDLLFPGTPSPFNYLCDPRFCAFYGECDAVI